MVELKVRACIKNYKAFVINFIYLFTYRGMENVLKFNCVDFLRQLHVKAVTLNSDHQFECRN